MSTPQEILNYLIDTSRKGLNFDTVVAMYIKHNDIKPSEQNDIKEQFKEETENYPNFDFVQKVLQLQYIKDADTNKHYLVDKYTKKIELIKEEALKSAFNSNAYNNINSRRLYTARLGYNPDSKDFLYTHGLLNSVNLYRPAEWQVPYFFKGLEVPKVEIPEIHVSFLNHLVKGEQISYNYIIHFLASCVQQKKKSYTYLTMLGQQGIGKGVFFKLCSAIVGDDNAAEINGRALSDSRFNSKCANKKILFFDELTIRNAEDDSAMKQYVNEMISVEGKHVDPISVKNYACVMVASNRLGNLRIDPDDRRYSFVDTTKVSLINFVTSKYKVDMATYVDSMLLDKNAVKQFGEYLLNLIIDTRITALPVKSEAMKVQKFNRLLDWEVDVFSQLAPKNAGKEITILEARSQLQEICEDNKIKPNRERWKLLALTSPGFFEVVRRTEKERRFYVLKFATKEDMPKFIASENED